jgi:hypothetical protein
LAVWSWGKNGGGVTSVSQALAALTRCISGCLRIGCRPYTAMRGKKSRR